MRQLLKGKIVTVTGGGGFIGRFVLHAILRHGATVRALMGAPGQTIHPAPPGVLTAISDIADATMACKLVEGSDAVVHLAGPASVKESFAQPAEYARVHVSGTETMANACRATGVKRFVYMSSAEVYGRSDMQLVSEDHRLDALSPYGKSKIDAEKLVEAFACSPGVQAAILRPFSVYGPGVPCQSVLGTILHQAQSNDCVQLRDLRPMRDYCYVEDLADAIVLSCIAGFNGGCVMNIGTGIGTSVGELARLVLEIYHRNLQIREADEKERPAGCEIYRLVADNSLARRVLGWNPKTPLRLGLRRTVQCFVA